MNSTPDEKPKKAVAKKVVTPKRRYFVPAHGSIEATSLDDAVAKAQALDNKADNTKDEQVGDAR